MVWLITKILLTQRLSRILAYLHLLNKSKMRLGALTVFTIPKEANDEPN